MSIEWSQVDMIFDCVDYVNLFSTNQKPRFYPEIWQYSILMVKFKVAIT